MLIVESQKAYRYRQNTKEPRQSPTVMAENQQELTNELTAVRAQLQQVVSRLGSIEGKKIRFSLWHNSV